MVKYWVLYDNDKQISNWVYDREIPSMGICYLNGTQMVDDQDCSRVYHAS